MIPPIHQILSADAAVTALVPPLRIRGQGYAGDQPAAPYITWQLVGGLPHNYVGERPGADAYRVQIDVYSKSASQCREIAAKVRDAMEPHGACTSLNGDDFEADTQLYRYSADWSLHIVR
ncbi:DUF3168 domain-containing protein [Aquilutibacter rugosus]|uniref:DUF3168 domain-containing protein n=1 Tax=Aquilutibacter rugosus TaxID=3115820 RepID=UPI002F3FC35B